MLGSANSQTLIREGYSLKAVPKVTIEWNHNHYNRPRLCGTVLNDATTKTNTTLSTNIVTLTANSGGAITLSNTSLKNGTSGTFGNYPKSFTFNSYQSEQEILTFPATSSFAYKIAFYAQSSYSTAANYNLDSEYVMIHFTEKDSGGNIVGGMTKKFDMDFIQWRSHSFIYLPTSTNTTIINMSISTDQDSTTSYTTVNISDFTVCQVNSYEAKVSGIYHTEDVFNSFKPGDEIAQQNLSKPLTSVIYESFGKQNINGSGSTKVKTLNKGVASSNLKMYIPSISKLKYYVSPVSYDSVANGVFAYYDTTLTTNKIVVKMLNSGPGVTTNSNYKNNLINYSLWTYNKTTNTWTNHGQVGTMGSNGSLTVYWYGSSWQSSETNATLSESNFTLSNTTTIDGIAFTTTSLGYGTTALGSLSLSQQNYTSTTLRFLEISPRLVVDVSSYIEEFSASKETDSSDLPISVGLSTSNNASVTLENLPRVYSGNTFSIFSDTNGTSPFKKLGLIDRDAKVRVKYNLVDGSGTTVESGINFFTGYIDRWNISEETAQIEMFDYSKYLQKKMTNDLLLIGGTKKPIDMSLNQIIQEVFQQNGFSDYNTLPTLTYKLDNFYTDNQKTLWENLQELFLPYSLMGYFDESGMFNVTNHNILSKSSSVDFVLTDKTNTYDSKKYLSNIVSLTENINEKPGKIIINYNSAYKHYSTDPATNTDKFKIKDTTSTQILWEASAGESLGFSNLKNSINASSKIIPLDQSMWNSKPETAWASYSGYALIGPEIIKYDGLEIKYGSSTIVVKSQSDLEYELSQIVRNDATSDSSTQWSWTGRLMNCERGMFGTKAQSHLASSNMSNITSYYPFAVDVLNHLQGISASPTVSQTISSIKNDDTNFVLLKGQTDAKQTLLYLNGVDRQSYDRYFFSFYIPQSAKQFTKTDDDTTGIAIGYSHSSGTGLYIDLVAETNTSKLQTTIYYNGKPLATSKFRLDTYDKQVTKKSTNKKTGKTKTVVSKKAHYDKMHHAIVSVENVSSNSSNMRVTVTVNGNKLRFNKDPIIQDNFSRDGKSIGMFVRGKNTLAIDTITAYESGTMILSPEFRTAVDVTPLLYGGIHHKNNPYYFSTSPGVYGMNIFDVDLNVGPAFNVQVEKVSGAHEIKSSSGSQADTIFKVSESQSFVSRVAISPFKARFVYLNGGESFIPLDGSGTGSFNSMKLYGDVIVKTADIQYVEEIDREMSNSNEIQMSSDWIQTVENAKKIAKTILRGVNISGNTVEIQAFGNPLLTIGDLVKLKYYKTNIVSDGYYVIVKADHTYSDGFDSTFTLRRIK